MRRLLTVVLLVLTVGGGIAQAATFDELMKLAREAYIDGQFARSLSLSEDALKLQPAEQSAVTTATLAACKLKAVAKAKAHYADLKGTRRDTVKQACAQSGVSL